MGVTPNSKAATFSVDANISELVYVCFQMTFATITPALIVGAFAERMKFSAVDAVHPALGDADLFPDRAHGLVLGRTGCDLGCGQGARRSGGRAAKTAAQAKLDEVNGDAGWLFRKGAIDFAGGTVVHINAGIAGLVGALLIGKRIGYGKDLMAPHSLTMTMIGASLLWVGWFGFNAGSNLEANGGAALAMTNSFVATAAAALSWMFAEWIVKGHPSVLGALLGRGGGTGGGHARGRLLRSDRGNRARSRGRRRSACSSSPWSRTRSATTTRSTCSASTASAESSARSAPASWSIRRSVASASWTTPPARSPTTTSPRR